MKTAIIILLVLATTLTSEGGPKTRLKREIKNLASDVKVMIQKLDDATSQITALTNKVDGLSRGNGSSLDPFVKLNGDPVCFGALGDRFGTFKVPKGGKLMKIKLVHLYGYVQCTGNASVYWSHWGCGYYPQGTVIDFISVSVTTASNSVLFPPYAINRGSFKWALVPGYSSRTPDLVMSIYDTPVEVTTGQELRLWYTEDLYNTWEADNGGKVCADVYGYYMPA